MYHRIIEKIPFVLSTLASILVFGSLFYYISTVGIYEYIQKKDTIIEGVLVEENFEITKISPILTSNIPIENSITRMIFEPLWKVKLDGSLEYILAEEITTSEDKKTVNIRLKAGIKWSDGYPFSADDVIATFQVLKSLNDLNSSSIAAQEVDLVKVGELEIRMDLIKYSPSVYEELGVGILPKHILDEDNPQNFVFHKVNKAQPIGTGPYVFLSSNQEGVKLESNRYYRSAVVEDNYFIRFYHTARGLANALQNSQIHLTTYLEEKDINVADYPYLKLEYSNPLFKRYWAMYFNLAKNENLLEDDKKYLDRIQDINIRKAIAISIDREKIAKTIGANVIPMHNFLPDSSSVLNQSNFNLPDYQEAARILESNGWVIDPASGYRIKDGSELSIRISFLNTPEKWALINEIVAQLKIVGIRLVPSSFSASDLANTVLKTKRYDILLYGVEAFIDPDRIRIWHSSQISDTGLNFSSYKSTEIVKDPLSGKEVSKSDDLLVRGRVTLNFEERKKVYQSLSEIINKDIPAIFLYQPTTSVFYNQRLTGINLKNLNSPSDIYSTVSSWTVD